MYVDVLRMLRVLRWQWSADRVAASADTGVGARGHDCVITNYSPQVLESETLDNPMGLVAMVRGSHCPFAYNQPCSAIWIPPFSSPNSLLHAELAARRVRPGVPGAAEGASQGGARSLGPCARSGGVCPPGPHPLHRRPPVGHQVSGDRKGAVVMAHQSDIRRVASGGTATT